MAAGAPDLGTGPTNQQGPFPQPGSTTPTGQLIGPLPASTMPGLVAQTIPVMANFMFLLNAINNIAAGGITEVDTQYPILGGPITKQGTISHALSGVNPGTYGDASNLPQITVDQWGHLDNVVLIPISSGPGSVDITATTPIVVTPSPLLNTGVVSHANSGVSAATYGDSTHVAQIAVNATGHVTSASNVLITTAAAVSITATAPVVVTPSPITGTGVISWTSPLTTKGDVYGHSTVDARIPVGTDAFVLTADSTQTLGVKWAPIPSQGTLQSQEFTSSGTYTVPSGVTLVWITMVGGGGGGSSTIVVGTGGGGGAAGESCVNHPAVVTPLAAVTVTIGNGGNGAASGLSVATAGSNGTTSSFGAVVSCLGGNGGTTTGAGGRGGGPGGAAGATPASSPAQALLGLAEAVTYFGGGGGGAGNSSATGAGSAGSGAGGVLTGGAGGASSGTQAGAGGGSSTIWGVGGAGGTGGAVGQDAGSTSYGAGGGGAGAHLTTTLLAGNGKSGYCLVTWIA